MPFFVGRTKIISVIREKRENLQSLSKLVTKHIVFYKRFISTDAKKQSRILPFGRPWYKSLQPSL